MKKPDFTLRPVIAGLLLFGSTVASASSITVAGTDASFTFDDGLLGIFGTPTVAGNILYFTPVDFSALSTNGDGTVVTQSAINVLVTPNQGVNLSSLGFNERGAYSLNGEGSYVGVSGQMSVFDVANPLTAEDTANITSSSDLTTNDNGMHSWEGIAAIDLTGSQWQNTGSFNVTLDNLIEATTASGASKAFIDKKFAGLWITADGDTVPPSAVPLPSAAWLLGSGLIGVVGITRRRKQSA